MSILEQIMVEKEEEAKREFSPQEALNTLFSQALTEKEKEILERHFALNGGAKETLEKVGQAHGVTRERIRQIEKQAIKKIKSHALFAKVLRPLERFLTMFFTEFGGFLSHELLVAQLFGHGARREHYVIAFILNELLFDRFTAIKPSSQTKAGWHLKHCSSEFLGQIKEELKKIFSTENPLALEAIWQVFQTRDFYKANQERLNIKMMQSALELFKDFARNPFSEYGLAHSSQVRPKRMHDRILLVLRKEKKPLHFREIARKIEEIFKRKAYPSTVHNELILNKEYVLVGRGIYALAEWGYKPGVVADIIEEILRTENRPLTRQEIIARVLKQRIVKENTIYLALTNKKRFKKLADGRYVI